MGRILPASTIGILGGGQLGRMTALAARRMGYRIAIYDPSGDCPAAPVADAVFDGDWGDTDMLREFARATDVISLEFENIPHDTVQLLSGFRAVRPGWDVLATCQNRGRERGFLAKHGFPQPDYRLVQSVADLEEATGSLGVPCVLKTIAFGYDGKGQSVIRDKAGLEEVWRDWGGSEGIVEQFVDFDCELSVICARTPEGRASTLPVPENIHTDGILDISIVPGRFPADVGQRARELASEIVEALDVSGMLAIEMFLAKDGSLLVNEMAPRPHNSGHFSFDACLTSQFEQHARAVCNLPPGDTRLLSPVVMVNILGDKWSNGTPDWKHVFENGNAKLHLYGKGEARPGRKMGHFCVLDENVESALDLAKRIKDKL